MAYLDGGDVGDIFAKTSKAIDETGQPIDHGQIQIVKSSQLNISTHQSLFPTWARWNTFGIN